MPAPDAAAIRRTPPFGFVAASGREYENDRRFKSIPLTDGDVFPR